MENAKKELTDVRRQLADCNIEKEKYQSSNRDLREHVKRTEGEKREMARSIDEAIQRISCHYFIFYFTLLKNNIPPFD